MSDNKQLKGLRDRALVNSNEAYEIEDLHRKYPHLSHQIISNAVKSHGPERKRIETYLNNLSKQK